MAKKQDSLDEMYILPEGDSTTTFQHDILLPSLPVPCLKKTLLKFIESVRPFVNEKELEEIIALCKDFEKGEGKLLHQKLLAKASTSKNWLEDWWEEYAYLRLREPLLPFYSMTGTSSLDDVGLPVGKNRAVKYASIYAYHMMRFWKLLRSQRMRPGKSADRKTNFSMKQYRRLFNCSRIPGSECDKLDVYFKTEEEGKCPTNVVVLCGGRIFEVNAVDVSGNLLSPPQWEVQLSRIQNSCYDKKGIGIGILTCDNRTSWAKNRAHLESLCTDNSKILKTIDSAVFVIILDDHEPGNLSEVNVHTLERNYQNRWADKSLQFVFFKNGYIGGISDHTAYDGLVSVSAFYYVYLALRETKGWWLEDNRPQPISYPTELIFKTDSIIRQELVQTELKLQANYSLFTVTVEHYTGYGKEFIQKQKFHPDSFFQMALQLAYYRLHNKPAPTYETASTRNYYNGRTETVRSCTVECVNFVKAMLNDKISNLEKKRLLEIAIQKHDQLMAEARSNSGCDRHLFGLYCIATEEKRKIHPLYSHPAYLKSGGGGNFILSSSLVGFTPIGGTVAPMCMHGYGCFYSMLPDSLKLTASAFRESTETSTVKLCQSLVKSLDDMHEVLEHQPAKL